MSFPRWPKEGGRTSIDKIVEASAAGWTECRPDVGVDPTATGLVVMAMLEQSWQMFRHNEIAAMPRSAVLAAATDLLWRSLSDRR